VERRGDALCRAAQQGRERDARDPDVCRRQAPPAQGIGQRLGTAGVHHEPRVVDQAAQPAAEAGVDLDPQQSRLGRQGVRGAARARTEFGHATGLRQIHRLHHAASRETELGTTGATPNWRARKPRRNAAASARRDARPVRMPPRLGVAAGSPGYGAATTFFFVSSFTGTPSGMDTAPRSGIDGELQPTP